MRRETRAGRRNAARSRANVWFVEGWRSGLRRLLIWVPEWTGTEVRKAANRHSVDFTRADFPNQDTLLVSAYVEQEESSSGGPPAKATERGIRQRIGRELRRRSPSRRYSPESKLREVLMLWAGDVSGHSSGEDGSMIHEGRWGEIFCWCFPPGGARP